MKLKLASGTTGFWNDETPSRFVATGSQMGRRDFLPDDKTQPCKLHLQRLKMSACGCYDSGGAYWGHGDPLYWAWGDGLTEEQEMFVRGYTRALAKAEVRKNFPFATFFR